MRSKRRRWLVYAAVTGLLIALAWFALGTVPPPLLVNRSNTSCAVTDREGRLLRLSLTGDEKFRLWTPLEAIPKTLQQATLDYEDRWFYVHPGVNPVALARAGWSSFVMRGRLVGASTLTMQLARQRFRLKTHHPLGKLRQIGYALWLERHFSKSTLLEAYLNLAPYGANIEGVGAAAWIYFHKPVTELSLDEVRVLALIPQNPRLRASLTPGGKLALQRAWQIAYHDDPGFERLRFWRRDELPLHAAHFAERVCKQSGENRSVASTLDPTVQGLAETLLGSFIRQHRTQGIANATVMVVYTPTMEVMGYVGSADYLDNRIHGFVNGLKARRSPGSTLKPFIYALALDQGLITPDSLLKDTPLRIGEYHPENFEGTYYGPLSATAALVRSRNIPAVALMAQLQKPTLYQFLRQAGLRLPRGESGYGLALAIGGVELSMEQLLTLYGLFANSGEYRGLRWLKSPIVEQQVLPTAGITQNQRLLSPEAAFLVRQMLEQNPPPQRSFGLRSFGSQSKVAWKTGTSSGLKDAWAVGLMGDWLAGVWVGNFDGTPNRHLVGRDMAGPLLFSILEAVSQEKPFSQSRSVPPPGLKRVEICPVSGALRSPWCPHGKTGWIIPGVSPIKICAVHRQIHVDPASGRRLCRGDEKRGIPQVAEFWDSDVLMLYRLAGLRREPPPAFAKPCDDLAGTDSGAHPPSITSPQASMTYPIRDGGQDTIEFSSISAGDRRHLFWFVDDAYVGEGATVHWPAKPGHFVVRVVDAQGQSASTSLTAIRAE